RDRRGRSTLRGLRVNRGHGEFGTLVLACFDADTGPGAGFRGGYAVEDAGSGGCRARIYRAPELFAAAVVPQNSHVCALLLQSSPADACHARRHWICDAGEGVEPEILDFVGV